MRIKFTDALASFHWFVLSLSSALRAFEQRGVFIVPHLLWNGTSVRRTAPFSRLLHWARNKMHRTNITYTIITGAKHLHAGFFCLALVISTHVLNYGKWLICSRSRSYSWYYTQITGKQYLYIDGEWFCFLMLKYTIEINTVYFVSCFNHPPYTLLISASYFNLKRRHWLSVSKFSKYSSGYHLGERSFCLHYIYHRFEV
jgi:hypothetical protein